jgi:hypothetical protein
MTEDEIAALRRYKPAEVVRLLNIPAKRLKTWVQEDLVPYLTWTTQAALPPPAAPPGTPLEVGRLLPVAEWPPPDRAGGS